MMRNLSILILTSVFVLAREKDNPPAACKDFYKRNKGPMGWKSQSKKMSFVGCLNVQCNECDIESCEYRDKYYLDYSKNEIPPHLYQETSIIKDKCRKLELQGEGHQISKINGYIPPFNYPGLAIKQSLHDLKFKYPKFKKACEFLIEKIEDHEKHDHYNWWMPCLSEKGYKENEAKCTGESRDIFANYEGNFRLFTEPTQAIIESLKKEDQDKHSKDWAKATIDQIENIKQMYIGVGYEWWLPCAMCQEHPSTKK
jgi:hypothetical protein